MPVVILGSGRCGTSMVTRMLSLCGLQIGPESAMNGSDDSNPTGYWEHVEIDRLNHEILYHFGGADALPADLPEGWHKEKWLEPIALQAKVVLGRIAADGEPWGWKDNNIGHTLPFWQSLVPNLKLVVCFRNPVDVCKSFDLMFANKRSDIYFALGRQGMHIWETTYLKILKHTQPEDRIFVSYEQFFPDYHSELSRVLSFVGMRMPEAGSAAGKQLKELYRPDLKHHHTSFQDLLHDNNVAECIKQLYIDLLRRRDGDYAGLPLVAVESDDMVVLRKIMIDLERRNIALAVENERLQKYVSAGPFRMAKKIRDEINVLIKGNRVSHSRRPIAR
jgi:hypothetical protein